MKTELLSFFGQNLIGVVFGIGYCAGSFLIFFFGLSYGASCPESGPGVCNAELEPVMPILLAISLVPITIFGIIFYSGQQLMLLFGMTTTSDYSSSFFAINILPAISIAATLFVCAAIGGFAQRISRMIRK